MAEGESEEDEDEVGYGKPPKKHQWPKNVSGNPRGRPKGARGLKAELREELNEFVTITENGKTRRIRKRRLVIKALAAQAAKGNVAAADKLIQLIVQAEGFEDERNSKTKLSDNDEMILKRFLDGVEDADGPSAAGEPASNTREQADAPDDVSGD